jgi:hypothetical protein
MIFVFEEDVKQLQIQAMDSDTDNPKKLISFIGDGRLLQIALDIKVYELLKEKLTNEP